MKTIARKMTLALATLILLVGSGCTGSNSTNTTPDAPLNGGKGPFVTGTWMDHGFIQQLEDRDFNSGWSSISNFTGFATFLNEAGKPYWIATIPDMGGELNFHEGKWRLGERPILEFFVEGNDTLARYFETATEFKGKGGLDHPQIYQRVPCAKKTNSNHVDDWYISEDCAFFAYYFAGKYSVSDIKGNHSIVELLQDGAIKGHDSWKKYSLSTVNTLPVLYISKRIDAFDPMMRFVINGNDSGFALSQVLNMEILEGDDNEIVEGPHVYDFVRK